jgi:hypothetical protein
VSAAIWSCLTISTRPKTAPKPAQARGSLLKDASEGAAFLFGNKLLLGLSLRPPSATSRSWARTP